MATKCLILRKVKIVLIYLVIIKISAFSQDNNSPAQLSNIEKIQTFAGEYAFYDEKNYSLALKQHDSLIYFKVYDFVLDPESYSLLLMQKDDWENSNTATILNLSFYVQVYYDFQNIKMKHDLVCLNIQDEDNSYNFGSFSTPTYDTNIYSLNGYLTRVDLGDYLHITIKEANGIQRSFWVSSNIDEETLDRLYDFTEKDLNIGVNIKYYKTISYLPEAGRLIMQDNCIEIHLQE